jgi:hypothetical protein
MSDAALVNILNSHQHSVVAWFAGQSIGKFRGWRGHGWTA